MEGMATNLRGFVLTLAIGGCAGIIPGSPASDTGAADKITLTPGQIAAIRYKLPADTVPSALNCNGRSASFYIGPDGYLNAYISEPYLSRFVPYTCRLQTSKGEALVARVTPVKKAFPRESLRVDPDKVVLSKKDALRAAKERKIIADVYRQGSSAIPYFDAPFMRPVSTEVTSVYGIRRIFNKQQKGQHLGVDFAADEGTPVKSSNRGRIVFTGDLFYAGNVVIIDHGLGIYTIYAHLSKIDATESDVVEKGEVIGLSGRTGRVTGPHVHWGVRVMGELSDGQSIVNSAAGQ
jgi:murein DD-endopeptidase MepM/ murein hydrolase activator NlpD